MFLPLCISNDSHTLALVRTQTLTHTSTAHNPQFQLQPRGLMMVPRVLEIRWYYFENVPAVMTYLPATLNFHHKIPANGANPPCLLVFLSDRLHFTDTLSVHVHLFRCEYSMVTMVLANVGCGSTGVCNQFRVLWHFTLIYVTKTILKVNKILIKFYKRTYSHRRQCKGKTWRVRGAAG